MEILIKRLNDSAVLPHYGSEASSGIDLFSAVAVTVEPGQTSAVATGIAIAIPVGYVGVISDNECCILDVEARAQTSIVDSGYRKEIVIEVKNNSHETKQISIGDKVAEMLVHKVERPKLIEAEDLS